MGERGRERRRAEFDIELDGAAGRGALRAARRRARRRARHAASRLAVRSRRPRRERKQDRAHGQQEPEQLAELSRDEEVRGEDARRGRRPARAPGSPSACRRSARNCRAARSAHRIGTDRIAAEEDQPDDPQLGERLEVDVVRDLRRVDHLVAAGQRPRLEHVVDRRAWKLPSPTPWNGLSSTIRQPTCQIVVLPSAAVLTCPGTVWAIRSRIEPGANAAKKTTAVTRDRDRGDGRHRRASGGRRRGRDVMITTTSEITPLREPVRTKREHGERHGHAAAASRSIGDVAGGGRRARSRARCRRRGSPRTRSRRRPSSRAGPPARRRSSARRSARRSP